MTTPDPRISKPHRHKAGFRCEVKTSSGWRHGPTAPTEDEATTWAQQAVELQKHESSQTVVGCIDKYVRHHEDKGTRAKSIVLYRQTLTRFFGSTLDRPLGWITPARAAALYESLRMSLGERTGRPLSVDYHRNALANARGFLAWCVGKKWIRSNALASVVGIGAKRRGREQPTIDEGKVLWDTCLQEAARGDDGALATAIAITMGMRAGEIVSRTVRDLDNKGPDGLPQHMRIGDHLEHKFQTKTSSSKRPVLIPEELRPLLVERARDKLPGALLMPSATGGLQWSSWVNRQVARLCRLAGIPRVCAHALRGFSANTAASVGESPQTVARTLGHSSTGVTLGHYIQKGTVESVERAEGLRVLRGGK